MPRRTFLEEPDAHIVPDSSEERILNGRSVSFLITAVIFLTAALVVLSTTFYNSVQH